MSLKKAQAIVNEVDAQLGISLTAYQNSDLEYLKHMLEDFLDLDVDTGELQDPNDIFDDAEELLDEEEEELC